MRTPIINNSGILIFASILIIAFSAIVFSFLGLVVFAIFVDSSVLTNTGLYLSGNYNNPAVINFLKTVQIFQSLGMFVIPPLLIAYISTTDIYKSLSLKKYTNFQVIILSGIVMISALPFIDFLSNLNAKLSLPESLYWLEDWMKKSEQNAAEITKAFLNVSGISGLLVNILMIAIIPAIGEELMFRGFLQNFLAKKYNIHFSIFISALIFSAIHFQFYGFLPRFLMGLYFGYLLYKTGSIYVSMFAHFVNNGFAVVISYFYGADLSSTENIIDNPTTNNLLIFVSVFITAFLIYRLFILNNFTKVSS